MNEISNIVAASAFVSSTFLVMLGLIIIIIGVLIINNLIMRFWKPMGISNFVQTSIMHGHRDPKEELDKTDPR